MKQEELLKLEKKFEEQRREIDEHTALIEKIKEDARKQTEVYKQRKETLLKRLNDELHQFEEVERQRVEKEKQAFRANLEEELKQSAEIMKTQLQKQKKVLYESTPFCCSR